MVHGKKLRIGAILLLLGLLFSTPISDEVGNSGGFDDGGSDWGVPIGIVVPVGITMTMIVLVVVEEVVVHHQR